LHRLTLALSLLGIFVFGAMAIVTLIDVGLPGLGGELVIPLTALTFAIWGFAGVMVLWDSRRSLQAYLVTMVLMLPFALAPQLRIFALVGVWGALLAYLANRIYQRERSNPDVLT